MKQSAFSPLHCFFFGRTPHAAWKSLPRPSVHCCGCWSNSKGLARDCKNLLSFRTAAPEKFEDMNGEFSLTHAWDPVLSSNQTLHFLVHLATGWIVSLFTQKLSQNGKNLVMHPQLALFPMNCSPQMAWEEHCPKPMTMQSLHHK